MAFGGVGKGGQQGPKTAAQIQAAIENLKKAREAQSSVGGGKEWWYKKLHKSGFSGQKKEWWPEKLHKSGFTGRG